MAEIAPLFVTRLYRAEVNDLGKKKIDFDELAQRHELAGGAIINVLRHACLSAVGRQEKTAQAHDLIEGIRREKQKDGQYVSRGNV